MPGGRVSEVVGPRLDDDVSGVVVGLEDDEEPTEVTSVEDVVDDVESVAGVQADATRPMRTIRMGRRRTATGYRLPRVDPVRRGTARRGDHRGTPTTAKALHGRQPVTGPADRNEMNMRRFDPTDDLELGEPVLDALDRECDDPRAVIVHRFAVARRLAEWLAYDRLMARIDDALAA